jgi:FkbM family methyltransferase
MKIRTSNEWERWRLETLYTKEPETIAWLNSLKPKKIFWDVGANIGIYSIYAALRGVKVVAFEPDLKNYEALCYNVKINNMEEQVECLSVALGERTEIQAFTHQNEAGRSGGVVGTGQGKVLVYRGDHIPLAGPDYIKIDVDYGEYAVLQGMGVKLRKVEKLIIEINTQWFEIIEHLKKYKIRETLDGQRTKNRQTKNFFFVRSLWK